MVRATLKLRGHLLLGLLVWGAILLAALNGIAVGNEAQYLKPFQEGKELYGKGDYEKAAEELLQALALKPDLAEAHFILGVIYAKMGKNDLARERFARVLELDPDHVQSHNNLGVIYQATGLFDLAQEEFRKAIKTDPTYEPALINLARLYLDLASRQYEDLVKLKPDDAELVRAYRQILALDPGNPRARYSLARLLLQEGKEEEALEELRQAEKLDPSTYGPIRLYQEGRSQEKAGNYQEASREYRLALKLRPNYPEASYRLGMTQYFLERYAEAAAQLEQVVGKEGADQAEVHHYLGHIYSKLGKEDKAIAHLQKALALKDAPQSHWVLGQVYERRKEYAAAEREYREVARLEPNNQEVGARLEELKAKAQPPVIVAQPAVPSTPPKPTPSPPQEKATAGLVLPSFLLGLEGEQSLNILLVEKHDQRLLLYKCQDGNCQVVKTYHCSTGQKEGDKRRVGDRRTPEGVYFLVDFKRDKDLAPQYGVGAFPMDYPNPIDRGKGKDGNGIWLHGTNKTSLPRTDTKGCVVVSNNDLLDLSRYIRLKETPTVIVEHLSPVSQQDREKKWAQIRDLIHRWKEAWESKRLDDYMAFYSASFSAQGMGWEGWKRHKEGINQKVQQIQVSISDLKVFHLEDFMVVFFRQGYRSDQRSDEGWKKLYLRREEEGRWRIVGEEWSPL